MLQDYPLTAIILAVIVLFCLNVLSCAYALGRFYAWKRDENKE